MSSTPNRLLIKSLQLLWLAILALPAFSQPKISDSLSIAPSTEYTYSVTGEKYVSKNTDLTGGEITGFKKRELVATNKEALTLLCSPAKGGVVNGQYAYQWQSSENCIVWKNISGARDENLTALTPPGQTTFFRRMVLEKISNTVTYSDVVTVFVVPAAIRPIDY